MGDDGTRMGEERLRVALEAGRMGTWEWDVATGVVSWSSTLEQIHGIPVGSFAGTFEAYEHDIHPDDRRRVLSTIQVSATGLQPHELEYRIVRPDGEIRWLEARGRVVCDAAGHAIRMLGVCMDVTDRKHLELERERLSEELRHVGQFREALLTVVAHDLRNPLAAISALAQWLSRGEDLPPAAVADAGAKIADGTRRMGRMIDDLLDFAHGRLGGGIPVTLAPADLGALARRALDELRAIHPGRALELVATGDLTGALDADRIAQLLSNLFDNAVRHGDDPVRITLRGDPAHLVAIIHNRGTPIPTDAIPHLFEPFKRPSSTRAGLGLGLYIASEIVRAHAGSIEVRSSVTDGTTFTITLPRAPRFSPPTP